MEVLPRMTCELIWVHTIDPWVALAARMAMMREQEWYFFIPKDRKYPRTGVRANRATSSGYWKATGKDKENICSNRELEEMKKTPVSYTGAAPIEHPAAVHVSIADMRRFSTSDALDYIAAEIQSATRNFITRIGERGSGKVYKGMLHHGNEPVVKRNLYWKATGKDKENICSNRELEKMKKTPVSYTGRGAIEHQAGVDVSTADMRRFPTSDALHNIEIKHEADINLNIKIFSLDSREVFVEEVPIHSKFSHKNVVKPLGYCNGEHTLMTVMECMPKGNLNDRVHHSEIPIPLDVIRLGIAIGCAEALSYVHSTHLSSGNLVCHSNIKPAYILLDDNLTAKLADFGVSRLLAGGIMDPICIQEGCLTPRFDVYSPGVVIFDMDPIYTQEGCPIHMKIAQDMASALVFLLDEKVEPKISDFGLSRVHHADDHTHIPMCRAVQTHNGWLDAEVSGKPSAKRGIETSIGSHMSRRPRYLSVHHHPFMQILPSARKWITSKRTFGDIFKAWISAKPTYEAPSINAGPVSEYIIRKLFGIWNGLTENESQQHSEPDSFRSDHGKIAGNTKTSASWTIATAAPHHATGNRSLLSGFVTEHDDQFVHAVNRVPMKVLARGAVVTDTLILPDVWFVPGLKENLVSVSQLAELDHSIGFGRGECCIRSARDAKIVGKGRLQKGGHYVLDYLKVPLAI